MSRLGLSTEPCIRVSRWTVKRDCSTGRFLPRATRLPSVTAHLDPLLPRPDEDYSKACYPTKGQVMRAFVDRNRAVLDTNGGLDQQASGGEYDGINERYGLRGKRRVATMRQAIAVATDGFRCLDEIDLPALNETPGCAGHCLLPDAAYLRKFERERYGRGEEVPF